MEMDSGLNSRASCLLESVACSRGEKEMHEEARREERKMFTCVRKKRGDMVKRVREVQDAQANEAIDTSSLQLSPSLLSLVTR